MAMLEVRQPRSSETVPPIGGFFKPKDQGVDLCWTTAQRELLAQPSFVNTPGMIEAITRMADRLRDSRLNALARTMLSDALESEVQTLNEHLGHQGTWLLGFRREPLARSGFIDALRADYELPIDYADGVEWFAISGENVTGGKALSFPQTDHLYNPVLDLRIQTHLDQPVSYFAGAGRVIELPSQGSWFRFPLSDTSLQLLGGS